MSDYFSLLAARLAGAPEGVRPRTPARFEPSRRDDPGASAGPASSAALETGDASLEEAGERQAPAARPAARRAPSRHRDVARASEPPMPADADLATPPNVPRPDSRVAPPERLTREDPHQVERVVARSRDVSANEFRTPLPAPRRDDPGRTHAPEQVSELPRTSTRTQTAAARSPSPEVTSPRARVQRVMGDATERPQAASPSIQITIGRIEVQAVTPQTTPPPAPRRPEAPALTLDAYLERRNGREP